MFLSVLEILDFRATSTSISTSPNASVMLGLVLFISSLSLFPLGLAPSCWFACPFIFVSKFEYLVASVNDA